MSAVRLGLRLALTPANRWRSAAMLITSMLGALVVLSAFAIGRAELATASSFVAEVPRIMLAMVLAVALPCALMVATVARLSASMRDRRLANLRLIGLTPVQTRTVAATEAAGAAVIGTALAWPAWWLVQPVLASHGLAGRRWPSEVLWPAGIDQVVVALGLPGLVVALAVLPHRAGSNPALAAVRRASRPAPGLWRALPLLVGAALCVAMIWRSNDTELSTSSVTVLFVGIGLTGLGLVLVIPVFVRLCASLMLRLGRGPVSRIAGRRLEAQPAGVTRLVAALLFGLFLVTGARYVLVAFESTSQYVSAAQAVDEEQRVVLDVGGRHVAAVTDRALSVEGVDAAQPIPVLQSACGNSGLMCVSAVVLSCEQLARIAPGTRGCRDDRPNAVDEWVLESDPDFPSVVSRPEIAWRAGNVDSGKASTVLRTPTADLTALHSSGDVAPTTLLEPLYADFIISPDLLPELPANTWHQILLTGGPGRDLADLNDTIWAEHWPGSPGVTAQDFTEYDFVASMRSLIWTVAAVILVIGLLTFAIAAIDRAVERRREVVALQVVGVPGRLLRRAQWIEAVIPVGVGAVLAVGFGALAGSAYLTIDEALHLPWSQTGTLAGVAFLAAAAVAGLTVVASAPRIRPDEIRRE